MRQRPGEEMRQAQAQQVEDDFFPAVGEAEEEWVAVDEPFQCPAADSSHAPASQLLGSLGQEQRQTGTAGVAEEDFFPAIGEAEEVWDTVDDTLPSSSGQTADSNIALTSQLRGSSRKEQQCLRNSGTRSADVDGERSTKKIKLTQDVHASQTDSDEENRSTKKIKLIQDGSFQVAKIPHFSRTQNPNPAGGLQRSAQLMTYPPPVYKQQ